MRVTLLLLDDNRDTLRAYASAVTSHFEEHPSNRASESINRECSVVVVTADNVEAAQELLRDKTIDLVVVDLKIPGISGETLGGTQVISTAMEMDPLRPVIVMTGYGTLNLVKQALAHGVFDFIEKSVTAINELMDALDRAIEYLDTRSRLSRNPFARTPGAEPAFFGGRRDELAFFEKRLLRAVNANQLEHFLILGGSGSGKSTLLKVFKKICLSRGHIAATVSVGPVDRQARLSETIQCVVEGILRGLPYPINRFKRVMDYFSSVGISVLGSGFSLAAKRPEVSPQAFLHDTLVHIVSDVDSEGGLFIILLDDVDGIPNLSELIMTFKSVLSNESMTKRAKLLVGMAISSEKWSELSSSNAAAGLTRFFASRCSLRSLERVESEEVVLRSLRESGVTFSHDVMENIWKTTCGHPYKLQVVSYHLFDGQFRGRVAVDVWEKALLATAHDLGIAIYDDWLNRLGALERRIILALAEVQSGALTSEIVSRVSEHSSDRTAAEICSCLENMAESGILSKRVDDGYNVTDSLLSRYLSDLVSSRKRQLGG